MTDQLALTDAAIASVLTDAELAAIQITLGRGQLGHVESLLALIDELFFSADFTRADPTGGLLDWEVAQLRAACKLVAHHLQDSNA